MATGIQWTDETWNPTTGCTRISPGCKNCYAFALHDMRHAAHQAGKKVPAQYAKPFKELQLFPDRLDTPLHWKKPRRVFVNSMSDLFHEDVPNEFIADVFATMYEAQWHTFQVLTKRAGRMASLLSNPRFPFAIGVRAWVRLARRSPEKAKLVTSDDVVRDVMDCWPLPNVWLGVSVEDQKRADERIPDLLNTPAAVRFLSCEPLLGPLDLGCRCWFSLNSGPNGECEKCGRPRWLGPNRIAWAICGGESGPGARACDAAWIGSIVAQCRAAGTAGFVKQLGSRPISPQPISPKRSVNL